jgi:hypothetical protein
MHSLNFLVYAFTVFFHVHKNNCAMLYMSLEKTYTEDSDNSLSNVSALVDDFVRMQFESSSSGEEITNDNVDLDHLTRKLDDNIVEVKEGAAHIA